MEIIENGYENEGDVIKKLNAYMGMVNIAEDIDDEKLREIGKIASEEFDIDKRSRAEWEMIYEKAHELTQFILKQKTFPWIGAANIKYPGIQSASLQFHARAYGNMVKNGEIVKGRVIGPDPQGIKAEIATRVGLHMSYQLTELMDWEEDMDTNLLVLPNEGTTFKKTYYDAVEGKNVSEFIWAWDVVVNQNAKSISGAARISHMLEYYPYQIKEKQLSGEWLDIDFGKPGINNTDKKPDIPDDTGQKMQDPQASHSFIEQHRRLDLDGDGYEEPYIVTFHKETGQVVRIKARWDIEGMKYNAKGKLIKIVPVEYFTRYIFIPDPSGGFYGIGYGTLLAPLNESLNTAINQLLDAATRQNTGGGLIDENIRINGQRHGDNVITFLPGEYKTAKTTGNKNISDAIFELKTAVPSATLYNLISLLITTMKDMSSVSDLLAGQARGANESPTTVQALIEQGLKVFSSIFKRVYRSMRSEFKKLYRLNKLYLSNEEYFYVHDTEGVIARNDYNEKTCDVIPVADPNDVSDTQKLLKAQSLMGVIGQGFNDNEIRKYYLEALNIGDTARFIPEQPVAPPEDPKLEIERGKLELEGRRISVEEQKFMLEKEKTVAEIRKIKAEAILALAKAEAEEAGPQLQQYVDYYENMLKSANDALTALEERVPQEVENTGGA